MNLKKWSEYHNGEYSTQGVDKICELDDWYVAIMPDGEGGEIINISQKENQQETDYSAKRNHVKLTKNGVELKEGQKFIGNMRDRTEDFTF